MPSRPGRAEPMSFFPAFEAESRPPQAARLAPKLREFAGRGIYLGTSSWKYPGWLGSIYSLSRYETRGKFSQKKFDETCLKEYVETFPVVCGDFPFYRFPGEAYWAKLFGETADSLSFAFKVLEDVTASHELGRGVGVLPSSLGPRRSRRRIPWGPSRLHLPGPQAYRA